MDEKANLMGKTVDELGVMLYIRANDFIKTSGKKPCMGDINSDETWKLLYSYKRDLEKSLA